MRVALVYNQKKEDAVQQSSVGNFSEPLTLSSRASQVHLLQSEPQHSVDRTADVYAEWDTADTIKAVTSALDQFHDVVPIEADEGVFHKLQRERPEIVFNIAEGLYGSSREAQVPAMLEMLRIPYTGSDPLTLAVCLDKSRAKEILSYYRIPTPRFHVVSVFSELQHLQTDFPCVVKPLHEGSSKGIYDSSLVSNTYDLQQEVGRIFEHYNEPALIEKFLPGREFTVAMLGNGNNVTVLPIVEIKFASLPAGVNHIYSYEAKWIWDQSDTPLDIFDCPAHISANLSHEIESICRRAYDVLRCRDWCRVDVRLDEHGVPNIIELNPLPGILPRPEDNSCFPKAARVAGIGYNELIQTVLVLAAKRCGLLYSHAADSFIR